MSWRAHQPLGEGWTLGEPRYPRTGARSHTRPPGSSAPSIERSHGEALAPDDDAGVVVCIDVGGELVVLIPDVALQLSEVHQVPRIGLVVRPGTGGTEIALEIGRVLEGKVLESHDAAAVGQPDKLGDALSHMVNRAEAALAR